MSTAELTTQNGHAESNGSTSELSAAQKLMQKHDETHKATIEEVPDEDDQPHGERPKSASILESANDEPAPSWVPTVSAKAAGKQKTQELPTKENKPHLDTQSHDLFPELGGAPKLQAAPVASIWGAKKSAGANGTNSAANGTPRSSTPGSGTATPVSQSRGGPTAMAIPGRHVERIPLAPSQILPRAQLKKPIPDVLKDINKKSKATVTSSSGPQGVLYFTATGPQEATRQALRDVVREIGVKASVTSFVPT
jgi:hypothetical protein